MRASLLLLALFVVARGAGAQSRPMPAIPLGYPDWPYDVRITQREYDQAKLLEPSRLSEVESKGRILWVQRCALCHDGVGTPTYQTVGPRLDADKVKTLGDARARQVITQGSRRMPAFQYGLSTPQIDALLAFLKTVKPGDMSPLQP